MGRREGGALRVLQMALPLLNRAVNPRSGAAQWSAYRRAQYLSFWSVFLSGSLRRDKRQAEPGREAPRDLHPCKIHGIVPYRVVTRGGRLTLCILSDPGGLDDRVEMEARPEDRDA